MKIDGKNEVMYPLELTRARTKHDTRVVVGESMLAGTLNSWKKRWSTYILLGRIIWQKLASCSPKQTPSDQKAVISKGECQKIWNEWRTCLMKRDSASITHVHEKGPQCGFAWIMTNRRRMPNICQWRNASALNRTFVMHKITSIAKVWRIGIISITDVDTYMGEKNLW